MQRKSGPPIIVLLGPTAVGKTPLSLALAELWSGEIITADSLQVYRYVDIGSAKVSLEERRGIPHHLLDLVEPHQSFTAGDYLRLARVKIGEIRGRGSLPLVVGGCGLYIRALADGLFVQVSQASGIKGRLQREAQEEGGEALFQRLRTLDPASAHHIHPHDTFRVIRALEIFEVSGKKPSELRALQWRRQTDGDFLFIGLLRERASLCSLIEKRIDAMIEGGFLSEVRFLLDRYSPDCKPFQGLGYKHMVQHLLKGSDYDTMVSLWKRDTRRYAKRQLTWFKRDDRIQWISLDAGTKEALGRIQDLIRGAIP